MLDRMKQRIANLVRDGHFLVESRLLGVKPEFEVVYQNIFDRDLSRLKIANTFYPLNAAANYGLLYLILRSAIELEVRSIVELGAGQSTLLIQTLRKQQILQGAALTIEHDAEWAGKIQQSVEHLIARVPLISQSDSGHSFESYDLSAVDLPATIDLLLIDGPLGWGEGRTYARHGALPLLDRLDPEGFVIIIDDAEREGERALERRIRSLLIERRLPFKSSQILAAKRQVIFASGRMAAAAFF